MTDAEEAQDAEKWKLIESGMSLVRANLMTRPGYSAYCGSETCRIMPRTKFTGTQFHCPCCGWESGFPEEFINEYKAKWSLS